MPGTGWLAIALAAVVVAEGFTLVLAWTRGHRAERALRSLLEDCRVAEAGSERSGRQVEAAQAEAARLRQALDSLPQGVVVRDERGGITFRNSYASALLDGRGPDLLVARAVEEQLEGADPEKVTERTFELYGPPRRWLNVRTTPLGKGVPLGFVAVVEDVSERSRLESVRRDFVANVSHELKTPIAALGLLAETMADSDDPEVTRRLAQRLHTEAFRVSRIIEDLLDLSRIEVEKTALTEEVDLNDLVAEAVDRIRAIAETRGIPIELHCPEKGPKKVKGDPRQLVSAVYNLLDNAVKYSEPGSPVVIGLADSQRFFEVTVKDRGIGIPQSDLERIFERFYRVDQARSRATGGTGLGLAIVRHVAANHDGEIMVESSEGQGSTFTLRIPASRRLRSLSMPGVG